MADRECAKEEGKQDKEVVVQLDDTSSSSTFSNSSIESTLTDKSDVDDFPKPTDSSPSPAEDPPPNYDPTRIPSSVFSCRNPCGGADWSVNSNESLFSITMGNNSFSRDHAFVVYKCGELLRLDEVFSHPTMPPLPAAIEAPASCGGAAPSVPNKTAPGVTTTAVNEEQGNKKPKPEDVGSCAASDGSGASNCSFAFPILINNKAELISELPSARPQVQSIKSPEPQPGNAPTPKPHGLSSWLSCSFSCCSFRRK